LGAAAPQQHITKAYTIIQGQRKNVTNGKADTDPMKQLRQQQTAEAKLHASQSRQRAGVLKEQEKFGEAEAAENATIKESLRTPLPEVPIGSVSITE